MPADLMPTGVVARQGFAEEPLYHITRVFLAWLKGLFAECPEGQYRWLPDEAASEILITNQAPIPRDRLEQRPAIVTMLGPAQYGNLSLDNMQSTDTRTGARRHTDLVSCTMTVNIIAKMPVEARKLAWDIFTAIRNHNRLLQQWAPIHQIGNMVSIGQESPPGAFVQPEPDHEMTLVTVAVPFYFQWTYEITPVDAVPLRSIEAHMTAELGQVQTTAGTAELLIRRPSVRGVPLAAGTPIDRPKIRQTVKS